MVELDFALHEITQAEFITSSAFMQLMWLLNARSVCKMLHGLPAIVHVLLLIMYDIS